MFVPSFGLFINEANVFLFGKSAYYYPFILLVLNYFFYKKAYDLQQFKKRELFGLVFGILGFFLIFAVFYKESGYILEFLYNSFNFFLGHIGSGILALLFMLFSLILLFPKFLKYTLNIELNFSIFEKFEKSIKNFLMRIFGGEADNDDIEHSEPKAPIINVKQNIKNEDNISNSEKYELLANIGDNLDIEEEENEEILNEKQNDIKVENENLDEEEIIVEVTDTPQSVIHQNSILVDDFIKKASRASISIDEEFSYIAGEETEMIPERFLKPKQAKDFENISISKEDLEAPSYKRKNISVNANENTPIKEKQFESLKQDDIRNLQASKDIIQSLKYSIVDKNSNTTNQNINLNSNINSNNTPKQESIIEENKPEILDFKEENVKLKSVDELNESKLDFMPMVEEVVDGVYTSNTPIIKLDEIESNSQNSVSRPNLKNLNSQENKVNLNLENNLNEKELHHASILGREVELNKQLLKEIEQGEIEKPKNFILPSLDFLSKPVQTHHFINESEIDKKIYDLLEKLRRFKIGGDVISTYTGPVVTTFEFRPSADVKVSRILNLQDDLAMALKARSIRIQAPIPGKDVVGIEVPNEEIQTIYLREILESDIYKNAKSSLTMALGKDIVGNAFVTDLKKLPHLLIAGTTGSGKSVGINAMLLSLLYRNSPKSLRLMMIDPKMLEFSIYNEIPHLLTPVITEPKKAVNALSNMVAEMERRYRLMAEAKTKNIENYNEKMKEIDGEKLPFIVVIIDELADLMMNAGKDVEFYIARLAQMARASGIHLIVATQRPSVDVVTGLIKANLPSRLAYKVGQKIDSKVILDTMGAESLLGRGDCLFTPPGTSNLVRLHAPFASESEIEKIVEFLKAQQVVEYDESFLRDEQSVGGVNLSGNFNDELDELYEDAKRVIIEDQKTSISYLQRRLKIGYNRAANIIEQLSQNGVLSEPDAKGQREIL
ncbi:DNA translocase FtsK [Campylobacter sp. LR264d]|uniref:DNA translocase FtsK n=1 Tax=Campylobacter sp. LR264d TaxID=2593544 RepID=UPI00123A93BB|nr:DNA translocase FtsK [Campylobacter sp. LR264d]KAA6230537.1 DNA translocase FtsK [Campylobacter sp. LR264d]